MIKDTDKYMWFPYIMSEPLLNHDMLFDNLPMGALADIESKFRGFICSCGATK